MVDDKDNNNNDQDRELEELIKQKLAEENENIGDEQDELLTQYSVDEEGDIEHSEHSGDEQFNPDDDQEYYDDEEGEYDDSSDHEYQQETKKFSFVAPVIAGSFMIFVFVLVYMKYSDNCGLLGSTVENAVGKYLCRDEALLLGDSADQSSTSGQVIRKEVKDPFTQKVDAETSNQAGTSDETSDETSTDTPSLTTDSDQPTSSDPNGSGISLGDDDSTRGSEAGLDRARAGLSADGASTDGVPGEEIPPKPVYETPALLVAENRQKITNRLPARVKALGFRDGQEFKEGDILATLDCKEIELDLEIQKEIFKEKSASLENLKKLRELKSTSEYSVVKAEAEFGQSQKLIEKYENQLKDCVIKAEYDGKVISTAVTEREFLFAGKEIMTINNNKDLLVKAYVPIVWLEWLKVGTSFKLCMNMDCYQGVVTRIGAEVDAISQTLDVFGKLSEEDSVDLIAGLSGQINFEKQEQE